MKVAAPSPIHYESCRAYPGSYCLTEHLRDRGQSSTGCEAILAWAAIEGIDPAINTANKCIARLCLPTTRGSQRKTYKAVHFPPDYLLALKACPAARKEPLAPGAQNAPFPRQRFYNRSGTLNLSRVTAKTYTFADSRAHV